MAEQRRAGQLVLVVGRLQVMTSQNLATHGNGENGVYSLKWRLTERYPRWGTLADPRPGRSVQIESAGSAHLGFPAL